MESKVPSKVLIFGCRLILNKLPTGLAKHGIIEGAHNVVHPLCFSEEEDVEHLPLFLALFGPSFACGFEWVLLSL